MKNQFSYPAIIAEQEEGSYLVQFPGFPEAITQGGALDEALKEAIDCLEEAIANRIEMKLDIPSLSSHKKSHYLISLHTTFAAKTALYQAMREQKLNNNSISQKTKLQ